MKKTLVLISVLVIIMMTFSGCTGIVSESYSATGLLHGNATESAFMEFKKFSGTMVFKLDTEEGDKIRYSAKLGSGKITVYEKTDDGKEELFKITADEPVDASFVPQNTSTTIIVEALENCGDGNIRFEIEEAM